MRSLLPALALLLSSPAQAGMEQHLREAVALNRDRMARYAERTDGRSDALFLRLILSEQALLPLAHLLDRQAAPFVARGIPVVEADFVPMDTVAPFGTPLTPALPMGDLEVEAARRVLRTLWTDSGGSLEQVVAACAVALGELRALERDHGVRFAMSRHLVESLGYCALHGIEHNAASGGETEALVTALVGLQRLGLVTLDPVGIDRQANVFHTEGLGVIVHEVPPIPFEAELGIRR